MAVSANCRRDSSTTSMSIMVQKSFARPADRGQDEPIGPGLFLLDLDQAVFSLPGGTCHSCGPARCLPSGGRSKQTRSPLVLREPARGQGELRSCISPSRLLL